MFHVWGPCKFMIKDDSKDSDVVHFPDFVVSHIQFGWVFICLAFSREYDELSLLGGEFKAYRLCMIVGVL